LGALKVLLNPLTVSLKGKPSLNHHVVINLFVCLLSSQFDNFTHAGMFGFDFSEVALDLS
jgi:hypothetical protein